MGKHQVKEGFRRGKKESLRAIFLDRDGVVNRAIVRGDKSYSPNSLDEFEILPGVKETCALFKKAGYVLVIATNQPDVGRGIILQSIIEEMHSFLSQHLPIDHIEVCYHPGGELSSCDCRKPNSGMLVRAASKLGLDLKQSWMIGDRWSDIECGHLAGCRTILIGDGYKETLRILPDFQAPSLRETAAFILG